LCGSFSGTLVSQGSGGNSGCWTGNIVVQLKSTGFPSICVNQTLTFTLCSDVHGNLLLTVECGNSSQSTLPGPIGCNPMDAVFTNVPMPSMCPTLEGSLPQVEITGSILG
jgi:hypothetical protein